MREDWNRRAREDARYYVGFGGRGQEEAEFQATAADVVRGLEWELGHFGPGCNTTALCALEIGCGVGRLMLPLSQRFREIHGVDVSDEMIGLARERLTETSNAHVQVNDGVGLGDFADESFDFVYSYAVFQHVPKREVVFGYLVETRRVLKVGGLARCQVNGLPATDEPCDTWAGVHISEEEIRSFALDQDFQLLALEGAGTQYMWITMRKQPRGWHTKLARRAPDSRARIRRITNAFSSEPFAASKGRSAIVSLWMQGMPADCDLLHMGARIGGLPACISRIGPPESDGLQQVVVMLPPGITTGLRPVRLDWLGRALCPEATLRVIPAGPEPIGDARNIMHRI